MNSNMMENSHSLMKRIRFDGSLMVCVLIFLSFFVPRSLSIVKLIILLLAIAEYYLSKRVEIKKNLTSTRFITIYLIYALGTSVIGLFRGNPGAGLFFRVNVIYYILLYSMSFVIDNRSKYVFLLKACCITSICISLYTFMFFVDTAGIFHIPGFRILDTHSGAVVHSGYLHVTNNNGSMLIFLFPLTLFILNTEEVKNDKLLGKLDKLSILLSFIAMFISGRRILWIVAFASLIIFIFQEKERRNDIIKKFVTLVAVVVLVFITYLFFANRFGINTSAMIDRLSDAFADREGNFRWQQIFALWEGFLQYPVFGSGAGIGVSTVVRNYEQPWLYEMSYNQILYNSGLVGFSIYLASMCILVKALYTYAKRDNNAKGLLFGFICGLISNATNPYFSGGFDFLFWAFIPIMYINIVENIGEE